LVIDPRALAGAEVYNARMETLLSVMLQDENVRLPAIAGTILPTGSSSKAWKFLK
jgi:hypothetical protein